MPITLMPPPGRTYQNAKAAKDAWERGEPFIIRDPSHPQHGQEVTCALMPLAVPPNRILTRHTP